MSVVNLRNVDEQAMAAIRQAAAITGNTITGMFVYSTVKYAAALLEEHGSPLPAGLDPMRRRGPLSEIEERVAKRAEQPASVDGLAELRDENNALRDEITRLRGWMYNMRRAARRAEETVSDIVAVADEEC